MVSSLRSGRNVTFRILDVDWCTSDKVILASDDGCIRVLEMSMKSTCFRMDEQELIGEAHSWEGACCHTIWSSAEMAAAALFQRTLRKHKSNHFSVISFMCPTLCTDGNPLCIMTCESCVWLRWSVKANLGDWGILFLFCVVVLRSFCLKENKTSMHDFFFLKKK